MMKRCEKEKVVGDAGESYPIIVGYVRVVLETLT